MSNCDWMRGENLTNVYRPCEFDFVTLVGRSSQLAQAAQIDWTLRIRAGTARVGSQMMAACHSARLIWRI